MLVSSLVNGLACTEVLYLTDLNQSTLMPAEPSSSSKAALLRSEHQSSHSASHASFSGTFSSKDIPCTSELVTKSRNLHRLCLESPENAEFAWSLAETGSLAQESDGGVSLAGGRPGADQDADESGSTLPPPYFTIPYS